MKIITDLFSAAARRERQLDGLRAKLVEHREEHEAAVAENDDAAQVKAHRKIEATEAEIRAIEAGIASAQRQAGQQRQAHEAAQREREFAEVRASEAVYRDLAIDFEADVMALAQKWPAVQAAFEDYRGKAIAAHVEHMGSRGLAPGAVWSRVWTRLLAAVKDPDRAPLVMPRGAPVSVNYPSVAESFAKEDRAAPAVQRVGEKEA